MKLDLPPLALYQPLEQYRPVYGDYIVWSGLITTWHGVVTNYDEDAGELHVVFSGIPFLLFTMLEKQLEKETRKLKLVDIKNAPNGKFAIQQQKQDQKAIWYI